MPLRLDNASALPTCPQQQPQKNKSCEPRFKIDHAASPMPETDSQNASRPGRHQIGRVGRDHLGILGEIKSVHPGEIIGISSETRRRNVGSQIFKRTRPISGPYPGRNLLAFRPSACPVVGGWLRTAPGRATRRRIRSTRTRSSGAGAALRAVLAALPCPHLRSHDSEGALWVQIWVQDQPRQNSIARPRRLRFDGPWHRAI